MGFIRLSWHLNKEVICKIISRRKTTYAFHEEKFKDLEVRSEKTKFSVCKETLDALERVSLVDFDHEGGIKRLEAAVQFAHRLKEVKIDSSLTPMHSILEKENLFLREDEVSDGNYREKILANAEILEEEYFVAPPGNILRKT
ncbi:glutamyl-tRNA(Gln) amidotransferase subunit C, mitochondrial [Belonocnema kinseyi]|uniref:glutamyl-tRNA(Gln) amidotransferase subunit C, mitochondrial n=1 Tax=Belonocnema kinseyi TaxID=2817044 RepID=UPI00143CED43|nr:glutamyl-tRNA(Gln) amidotransferase subunit C, mitochondrial [Belonocnema kinseyi]